ncbi:MAG: SDR family oxidoreductase [Oscillospiraceae bacterium]|jgi:NAD(P)-dependent dehydrogenase (short-subunit alcohol dehydrogenase family)|nr:SDR family oxidoreductase [Oscillospiraceae bacterium]
MVDVKGKWTFITGASRGIGKLIAIEMAKLGSNIIAHSRSTANSKAVLAELSAIGVEAYAVGAELSDIAAVSAMLDEIERRGTQVDIVFNDAGMQVAYRKDYWKTPAEDFTKSFLINTIAPAMICYRLIPPMIKRGFGRVINTTSGIRNEPEQAGYSTSKAALDKFTRDLGSALGDVNIAINLGDPGWCRTDLGGQHAPNAPQSAIPGMLVGALIEKPLRGVFLGAQAFTGMTLEEAVAKAETMGE